MNARRVGLLVGLLALIAIGTAHGEAPRRSGYSYIRDLTGDATVDSRWNGQVEARRNMPLSAGDELVTGERGRAEIALADGNILQVGGASRVRFVRLRSQQGEEDDFSAIDLKYGSVVLAATGSDESAVPRIDTDDATVYLQPGARVRVNVDQRRGTVVVARQGTADVRTKAGSNTVRAGFFLTIAGDEEADLARGSFSRDRFDIWSADRLDTLSETRSASTRYVDEDYGSDVVALDGAGDWNYSSTYSTNVWTPRVDAGWTPYSNGSWYYTPAGLTWWSYDPWGWFPHHYGNWFFDTGWNRWCWAPSSVYSPAWVYWGFTSGFVGWCPIGWYSGYSPWWDTYYKRWNLVGRDNLYFSVHGTFATRSVDLRGWNFVGHSGFTNRGRLDVIPGSRIGDRLGSSVAISSRTIVVPMREGGAREAVQAFVREAPRVIERSANTDSGRMAPILSRQRDLPAASADAMRDRLVLPTRGRLEGPGVNDVAPRGALVDRSRGLDEGRGSERPAAAQHPGDLRGRGVEPARPRADRRRDDASSGTPEDWRGRDRSRIAAPAPAPAPQAAPRENRMPVARERPRDDWRSRPNEVPPARRVIEGAVPGHRPDSRSDDPPREYRHGRDHEARPVTRERVEPPPERRAEPPARRIEQSAPRSEQPRRFEPPPPRAEQPSRHVEAPPRIESRSAPPPPAHRVEHSAPPEHHAPPKAPSERN